MTFLNCDPAAQCGSGWKRPAARTSKCCLHIAPILLGDGIGLYDTPGSEPITLRRVGDCESTAVVNVRYRPATRPETPTDRAD